MSRKRKGISEILSAIILIMVVVSGMAIYTVLSQQRIFANTFSINEALKDSENKSTELLTKIWFTKTADNATAYIINYGFKNVTVTNVINGTADSKNAKSLQFSTHLLSDIDFTKPLGGVIPALPNNSTIKLFIKEPIADRISIITENGRSYELLVDNP